MKQYLLLTFYLSLGSYTPLLEAVCNTGSLSSVTGSPFAAGTNPFFLNYSPVIQGNVFAAVGNFGSANVSVYSVNTSTGVFTAVPGSPFSAGSGAFTASFSPIVYGNLFAAVANDNANTISVYSVNPITGVFTQVTGSPFSAGTNPRYTAFSPLINGNLFAAVTNFGSSNVSVYSVNTVTGVFTQVSGSPFSAGSSPYTIALSPVVNGNLFAAVANFGSNNVSVYSVNTSTGAFTPVSGSPFSTGTGTNYISFSLTPSGTLFAAVLALTAGTLGIYTVNTSTGALALVSSASGLSSPNASALSPSISGNLFAAATSGTNVNMYTVNASTGALTLVGATALGSTGEGVAFSPQLSGGLFVAAAEGSSIAVYKVATLIPTISTLSQFILSGATVSITGTISGGTQPYAITWQDSTVQSGISTTTFSRGVSPTSTTIYDVATISDTNSCTAGPSNTVTISVRTCP